MWIITSAAIVGGAGIGVAYVVGVDTFWGAFATYTVVDLTRQSLDYVRESLDYFHVLLFVVAGDLARQLLDTFARVGRRVR